MKSECHEILHQKVIQGLGSKKKKKKKKCEKKTQEATMHEMSETTEEMPDKIGSNKVNSISKTGKDQPLRKDKMDEGKALLCVWEGV